MLNLIQVQTQNIAEGMYFNTSDSLNNSKLSKDQSVVSFMPICEIKKMIPLAKIGHKSQFLSKIMRLNHKAVSLLHSALAQPT